ncbi:MAG: hypothetical protein Q4B32_05545 [Clostridia bacterium]|nr:hypothetical protein [Clostridia bacterium]
MQEKLTGKERTALLYLAALDDEMHKASTILRERLRTASPTGWRNWRLVQTTTSRLLIQLVDTLPEKDVRWLRHMLENGRMSITLPGPIAKHDYLIVDARDMADISRMAARQECWLCMKGHKEAQSCKLCKCLQNIAPMPDGEKVPDTLYSCEYAQVNWEDET